MSYFNPATIHRLSSRLYRRSATRPIARILEAMTFVLFHAIVPATATIGSGTSFEHRGIGVVIHPRAIIGRDCVILPHVVIGGRANLTLGARTCPTIYDGVMIGAGAKILGPISVGAHSKIGANAVVVDDVEPGATVVGIPARRVVPGSR